MSDPARGRWMALMAARLAGTAGAVLGIVLVGRATQWPAQAIGVALVLASLAMMTIVSRALARKWRSPAP